MPVPCRHRTEYDIFTKHHDSKHYGVKGCALKRLFLTATRALCPARRLNTCFAPVVGSSNSPNLHFSPPALCFRNSASVIAFGAGVGRRFFGAVLPATIWAPPRFALLTNVYEAIIPSCAICRTTPSTASGEVIRIGPKTSKPEPISPRFRFWWD